MTAEIFDFSPYKPTGEKSNLEMGKALMKADLYRLTAETIAAEHAILASAIDADVTFLPVDPIARDIVTDATDPWSIGHVIVHATASSEEAAAAALLMARGAPLPTGVRTRYEVPWETITTIAQVKSRLDESHRMRRAMLDAWPDAPHLDEIVESSYFGEMNATARFMIGLRHEIGHLDQLRDTLKQSIAARTLPLTSPPPTAS